MPTSTANHLTRALHEMKAELRVLEERAGKLQKAIAAAEDYVVLAGSAKTSTPARQNGAGGRANVPTRERTPVTGQTAAKPQRISFVETMAALIHEGGRRDWSVADLSAALLKRRAVSNDDQHTRAKIRKALGSLKHKGLVVAKRQGTGDFARTVWKAGRELAGPASG